MNGKRRAGHHVRHLCAEALVVSRRKLGTDRHGQGSLLQQGRDFAAQALLPELCPKGILPLQEIEIVADIAHDRDMPLARKGQRDVVQQLLLAGRDEKNVGPFAVEPCLQAGMIPAAEPPDEVAGQTHGLGAAAGRTIGSLLFFAGEFVMARRIWADLPADGMPVPDGMQRFAIREAVVAAAAGRIRYGGVEVELTKLLRAECGKKGQKRLAHVVIGRDRVVGEQKYLHRALLRFRSAWQA